MTLLSSSAMKRNLLLLSVILVTVVTLAVNAARLGTLNRDATVWTTTEDITAPSVTTRDGYPVFEIHVPEGMVEVQVRASLTNFEPGFLLKENGDAVHNYIPTDAPAVDGRKAYRSLGIAGTHTASWANGMWNFGHDGVSATSDALVPWDVDGGQIAPYSIRKELFVYRTCTTGIPSDGAWGTGSGDPDPWVYFANQSADTGVPGSEFIRQKWDPAQSMQYYLQAGGTPGTSILFQPSRGNLGSEEWMQQNSTRLVWIYQVQDGMGVKPTHPNGAEVWNVMHPKEWRKARITLSNQ